MKWLFALLLLIAVVFATVYVDGCFRKKQKDPDMQYVNHQTDSTEHFKDLYGQEHARVLMEVNKRQALEVMDKQAIDSLLRQNRIKDKQLLSYSKMLATAKGQFTTQLQPVYVHDSITGADIATGARVFEWHDDWLIESGIIDSNDIHVDYSISLPFVTSTYWKRKHHLWKIGWGKKVYYLDATCKNPNVSITGLQAVKIN